MSCSTSDPQCAHSAEHLPRTRAARYVGSPAAGSASAAAWALGLRLAEPHRRIVQVIGDGGFHFPGPTASMRRQQISAPDLHGGAGQWRLQGCEIRHPTRISQASPPRTDQFQSRLTSAARERREFSESPRRSAPTANATSRGSLPPRSTAAPALDCGKAAVLHISRHPALRGAAS